jgi:uncharacterized membrane protein
MTKLSIWLTTSILLLYFVFTSGLVYEITASNTTDKFIVPYSAALSGEHTGLIGIFTKDDVKCAEWLVSKSDESIPVFGDSNTWIFLRGYINQPTRTKVIYSPADILKSDHCYLFLRTWNIENQKIVVSFGAAGLRSVTNLPKIDTKLYGITFKSGNAIIYRRQ